ncbi:MAG: hypothetical protein ACKO43_01335 [Alphaproteobacteria bacterium]
MMRALSKRFKMGIVGCVLMALGGIALILFPKNPAESQNNPITLILNQSQMLRDMADRTATLGIQRQSIVWDGETPTSLSQIYRDLWPLTPPTFADTPPMRWQMGWAGARLVFFLDGMPAAACQALNTALNSKGPPPDSLWSKQDLLRRKAVFPPTPKAGLQTRGCVKTIYATHLYYDVL